MKELPDGSIDLVLADPPYGTTACKWDSIIPLEPMWEQLRRLVTPKAAIVMTASQPFTTTLISSNMKMFKYCWVWEKNRSTCFHSARYRPLNKHEDVVVFGVSGSSYFPQKTTGHTPTNAAKGCKEAGVYQGERTWDYPGGDTTRHPTTLLRFDTERGLHPTQKPVTLMEYLIKTYSQEGHVVLDFAAGSFTTGVACINTGRKFIGIEKEEKYFNLGVERMRNA